MAKWNNSSFWLRSNFVLALIIKETEGYDINW
jgi:hypothetical protein